MVSLWKNYKNEYEKYERDFPLAFPWNRGEREDVARYVLGEDGYWYDPSANESGRALISCTGDLMCEPRMTNACRYGDSYFFHPLFKYVRGILKGSDLSVANLETTLSDSTPYAGEYHRINRQFHCNGPECYLDALRYAGFDALVTANNHNCDSGVLGIYDTLNALDRRGFLHTGTYRAEDNERILLVKVNGIRVAILSYACRYNGLDERNFTNDGIDILLNYYSKEKIDRDTAKARRSGAEIVICYIHWGKDYDLVPGEKQLAVLETLRDADIDYIVGSHTHCLQANDRATSSSGREIPMMFSMGNFVTNEPKELCKHTGILQLMLSREADGIRIKEYFIPCYVFDEFHGSSFSVVPTDATLNGGYYSEKMTRVNEYVRERVGENIEFLPAGTLTLGELCDGMGVEISEEYRVRPVTKLCTEVGPSCRGAVYFSLGGESGYATRELIRRELCAVVTAEPVEGLNCITVPDVRQAFIRAAETVRRHSNPVTRIAVAGGEGKTLTRELISDVLSTSYSVLDIKDGYQIDVVPWQSVHPYNDFCLMEIRDGNPIGKGVVARSMSPDICVITSMTEGLSDIVEAVGDGTLIICGDDADLVKAIGKIDTGRAKIVSFNAACGFKNLPFADMQRSAGAALSLGVMLGIKDEDARCAIAKHRLTDYTHNVVSVDGIKLVLATNTKSASVAIGAADVLAAESGRKLAIIGETDDGSDLSGIADAVASAGAEYVFANMKATGGKEIVCEGAKVISVANERELENAVLEVLRDGDVLIACGSRGSGLCTTVQRLFGVTDGYIPNSEYWTGDVKLDY